MSFIDREPRVNVFVPANFGKYNYLIQNQTNDRFLVNPYGELYNSETRRCVFGSKRGRYRGYSINTYLDRSKAIYVYTHYIVACTFLDPPICENLEINHKDGNRDNNHYSNLEWITHRANIQHAIDTGLMPITGCASDRRACRARHGDSKEWIEARSFGELGRKLGVSYKALHRAAQNNRITHDYIVEFIDK